MKRIFLFLSLLLISLDADARIGLVTLPRREAVQLTIYNSADLTLVRERRTLTLAKGKNRLEFSWANTLIDPTSVQFDAVSNTDKVELIDISFPAQAPNALVWTIESEVSGEVIVEISYFTSGLTWSADYEATADKGGKKLSLNSFVKATNNSGEDYDGAQVRLIVGTIHLVEDISELANRGARPIPPPVLNRARAMMMPEAVASSVGLGGIFSADSEEPPEIIREGLSEYFIYTVSGEHSVPNTWAVRWLNFSQSDIDIENFYRYEEGRYNEPRRFFKLKNDEAHKLGKEPLPDGRIEVFQVREDGTRAFLGKTISKYVPVGEWWEIDLGADPDVIVKPKLMRREIDDVEFDSDGDPSGWKVIETWLIEVLNSRTDAIAIEIDRNFDGDFTLSQNVEKEKYDFDTIRFKRSLGGGESEKIEYTVTYRKGTLIKR
ncbi:MAG: hypothetical protein AUJ18_08620 [Candidatus Hydrogenedentes bacterium CG1_02_42_14]|nr:MAG: hypothetical protein AUJ18_08620 [Candidatus Hydrogenedentes bacterium CG1_02_42_14]